MLQSRLMIFDAFYPRSYWGSKRESSFFFFLRRRNTALLLLFLRKRCVKFWRIRAYPIQQSRM